MILGIGVLRVVGEGAEPGLAWPGIFVESRWFPSCDAREVLCRFVLRSWVCQSHLHIEAGILAGVNSGPLYPATAPRCF